MPAHSLYSLEHGPLRRFAQSWQLPHTGCFVEHRAPVELDADVDEVELEELDAVDPALDEALVLVLDVEVELVLVLEVVELPLVGCPPVDEVVEAWPPAPASSGTQYLRSRTCAHAAPLAAAAKRSQALRALATRGRIVEVGAPWAPGSRR